MAKRYILTDGLGNYIRFDRGSRRYVPIGRFVYATSWDNSDKAENIRRHLPKNLANRYYAATIEAPDESINATAASPPPNT